MTDDKVTPLYPTADVTLADPKLSPLDIACREVWTMMEAIADVKRLAEKHPETLARVSFTLHHGDLQGVQGMQHVLRECRNRLAWIETAIQNRSAARSKLPAFATVFADHEVPA